MHNSVKRTFFAVTIAACICGTVQPAVAQTAASAPVTAHVAPSEKPLTKAEQRKQLRAERKAERKAVHAKNTVELKKLQGAGYEPGPDDSTYPKSLQDAQKKAALGTGASQ